MTAHPIDTEALAKRAGHVLFTEGPEQPAATARETCVLLDLLAAAEHRATRAEARVKAVEDVLELHGPAHDEPGQDEADCGPQIIADIRRALDGTVTPRDAG